MEPWEEDIGYLNILVERFSKKVQKGQVIDLISQPLASLSLVHTSEEAFWKQIVWRYK